MITSEPTAKVIELPKANVPRAPITGPAPGLSVADPCSHVANAQRCVREYRGRILYVDGIGWHTWGPPWKHDPHGAAELVHDLGKIITTEAAGMAEWVAMAPRDEREERERAIMQRFRWARTSELSANIEATLRVAEPYFVVKPEALDANPDLVAATNGVLDLASMEFRPFRPEDRITKTLGTACDPNANGEAWRAFVAQIFGNDAQLADWFQRLIGYCLSGERPEHMLPIFYGSGSNGKSTALGALQAMFGDYGDTAPESLLIQKYGNDHPTQVAGLQGKRFVVASESSENGRLYESRIKALTGGDQITARRMRQDFFTFQPTHQLILQTNHRPKVTGTDEGIWRRLRLVPFTQTFKGADRDPDLPAKLKADLPGILKWAVEGYTAYKMRGLDDVPDAVGNATAEYRRSADVIGEFIAECCEVDRMWSAKASDIYRAYVAWCNENGEHASSQRDLGLRLGERGFERGRYGGTIQWRGLRLTPREQPPEF